MVRGSADAIALSDGRRFDGTLVVCTPAIRSARNDAGADLRRAASRTGAAAVEANGPTSDPHRTTIAIASAASRPATPRPSAGRRTKICMRRTGRSSSSNDITAITRGTAAKPSACVSDSECPSTAAARTSTGQGHRYQEYDQAPTRWNGDVPSNASAPKRRLAGALPPQITAAAPRTGSSAESPGYDVVPRTPRPRGRYR